MTKVQSKETIKIPQKYKNVKKR